MITLHSSLVTPVVVIACQVLQSMLEELLPKDLARQVTFMDYGLHRVPGKMTWTLQDAIDEIEEPSLVVLGYGLCGNGLNGIKAGKHTLLVPRTDDCIAMLLGSRQAYIREFEAAPGTYYLRPLLSFWPANEAPFSQPMVGYEVPPAWALPRADGLASWNDWAINGIYADGKG